MRARSRRWKWSKSIRSTITRTERPNSPPISFCPPWGGQSLELSALTLLARRGDQGFLGQLAVAFGDRAEELGVGHGVAQAPFLVIEQRLLVLGAAIAPRADPDGSGAAASTGRCHAAPPMDPLSRVGARRKRHGRSVLSS